MDIEIPGDSCELAQARPSPPPCQLHRANLLRSHPPHFALTASQPPCHHLSQSKCGGLPPLLPVCSGCRGSRPVWVKDVAKNKSKVASLIGHTGSSNYRSTLICIRMVQLPIPMNAGVDTSLCVHSSLGRMSVRLPMLGGLAIRLSFSLMSLRFSHLVNNWPLTERSSRFHHPTSTATARSALL